MFQEKDIEEFLLKEENLKKWVIEWGNTHSNLQIFNQVQMGSYGIVDILALHDSLELNYKDEEVKVTKAHIIEIKMADNVSYKELGQLCRYNTAFSNFLYHTKSNISVNNITLHLICRGIDTASDFCFVINYLPTMNFELHIFKIDLAKGFEMELAYEDWKKTDEGSLYENLTKYIKIPNTKTNIIEEAKDIIKE